MFLCNVCDKECQPATFVTHNEQFIDKDVGFKASGDLAYYKRVSCPLNLPKYFEGVGGPMPTKVFAVFCSPECSLEWHNRKEKECQTQHSHQT